MFVVVVGLVISRYSLVGVAIVLTAAVPTAAVLIGALTIQIFFHASTTILGKRQDVVRFQDGNVARHALDLLSHGLLDELALVGGVNSVVHLDVPADVARRDGPAASSTRKVHTNAHADVPMHKDGARDW